jgi:hypothetical protein
MCVDARDCALLASEQLVFHTRELTLSTSSSKLTGPQTRFKKQNGEFLLNDSTNFY